MLAATNKNDDTEQVYNINRKYISKPDALIIESLLKELGYKGYKVINNLLIQGENQLEIKYISPKTFQITESNDSEDTYDSNIFTNNKIVESIFDLLNVCNEGFLELYYESKLNLSLHRLSKMEIRIVDEIYLSEINSNHDIIYVKSGQGTGKSHQICQRLLEYINQGKNVLIYSNRISLSATISEKFDSMSKDKIFNYRDLDRASLCSGENIIISPESNYKLRNDSNKLHKYDVIWIDEAKKLMAEYPASSTLKGKRQSSLDILSFHIRMASEILISDADLNDDVISWIRKMRSDRESSELLIYNKRTTDETNTYIYGRKPNFTNRIHKLIKEDKKIYIGSSSVRNCKDKFLELGKLYSSKKILLIIGEYAEDNQRNDLIKYEMIKDCNSLWLNYDIVICSPCIIYGVSFDPKYFDEVFYEYNGILKGEYVNQALHRVRKIKNNRINVLIESDYIPSENLTEDSIKRLLNGNLLLLGDIVKDIRKRDLIFHSVRYVINDEGEYLIDDDDLLYKLMIQTEIENYESFQNIWLDIVNNICKNRNKPVYVERIWDDLNDGVDENEIDTIDDRYQLMNERPNLSFEEYEELKYNNNRTKLEELCIVKNRLRFRYCYDNVNEELLMKLEWFDKKKNGLMCYLKNRESNVLDVTDLRSSKINRIRYEEILKLLGFKNGIMSSNQISSDHVYQFERITKKLKDLQRSLGMRNIPRPSEYNLKIIMNVVNRCGEFLGLCCANKDKVRISENKFFNLYQLEQEEIAIEILNNLLDQDEIIKNQSYDTELIKLLGIQNLEIDITKYIESV